MNERISTGGQSTYILDAESTSELSRLLVLDRVVTRAMGGALAGLPELPENAKILDLACGPGGWALDMAYALPNAEVCGVDISQTMIDYANASARSQSITNASFGVMDITQPLDFAEASLDVVHARFLAGVLKRDDWKRFIVECSRLLRPGGFLQLVEVDDMGRSLSPALEQLNDLGMKLLWKSGYGFSSDGHSFGMLPGLLRLLKEEGYYELHLSSTIIDHSFKAEGWADFFHNQEILLHEIKPLLLKSGLTTDNEFNALFQQAVIEMQQEHFSCAGQIICLGGRKQAESR